MAQVRGYCGSACVLARLQWIRISRMGVRADRDCTGDNDLLACISIQLGTELHSMLALHALAYGNL